MSIDLAISFIAALLSSATGALATTEFVRKVLYGILKKERPKKTYSERLSDLTASLTKASGEVDNVVREMAQVAKERESSVNNLEAGLRGLEERERELNERIALLQAVPIPVAEHFARLVEPVERRSARRDYLLFFSGVVVTTTIAVVLQFFTPQKEPVKRTDPMQSPPAAQAESR
jgi:hypothetical protein